MEEDEEICLTSAPPLKIVKKTGLRKVMDFRKVKRLYKRLSRRLTKSGGGGFVSVLNTTIYRDMEIVYFY